MHCNRINRRSSAQPRHRGGRRRVASPSSVESDQRRSRFTSTSENDFRVLCEHGRKLTDECQVIKIVRYCPHRSQRACDNVSDRTGHNEYVRHFMRAMVRIHCFACCKSRQSGDLSDR
jgi:hypothetical protein